MADMKLRQYSGRNKRNYFTTKNGVVHLPVIFCLIVKLFRQKITGR